MPPSSFRRDLVERLVRELRHVGERGLAIVISAGVASCSAGTDTLTDAGGGGSDASKDHTGPQPEAGQIEAAFPDSGHQIEAANPDAGQIEAANPDGGTLFDSGRDGPFVEAAEGVSTDAGNG
jgi:hypothetical protein